MTFSERMGLKQRVIQVDSMDDDLRNSLWNVLIVYFDKLRSPITVLNGLRMTTSMELLTERIWFDFLKKPGDEMPKKGPDTIRQLKSYFMGCEWFEAYDFIEFIANTSSQSIVCIDPKILKGFLEACNDMLGREGSAYRLVGRKLVPVTSDQEIAAITGALSATNTTANLRLVNTHLKQALTLLADRRTPDYRNSMKESISAVECICKLIAGMPKATLGPALDKIKSSGKVTMHPALEEGLRKLYTYTCDSDGIRHALKDAPTVDVEDARYMLVMCAGFVSYLIEKARKAGIAL
ncbi:MAG TPA: hypothetical protein VKT82_20130 [Ktedonobacterales bacterium]|nr:hypothetical protein [Ktedonobacterales bacterium]